MTADVKPVPMSCLTCVRNDPRERAVGPDGNSCPIYRICGGVRPLSCGYAVGTTSENSGGDGPSLEKAGARCRDQERENLALLARFYVLIDFFLVRQTEPHLRHVHKGRARVRSHMHSRANRRYCSDLDILPEPPSLLLQRRSAFEGSCPFSTPKFRQMSKTGIFAP
jgi:hypothetical protein